MSASGTTYPIGKCTGVCTVTGTSIKPGDVYIATLCEGHNPDDFLRADFSLVAWESGARPHRLFCFWRTRMATPDDHRILIDDDALISLFNRLEGDVEPQRRAYRFVIGLILIRKRILRVLPSKSGDTPCEWRVRMRDDPEDSPAIVLADPSLSEEQIRSMAEQLGEILRGNF